MVQEVAAGVGDVGSSGQADGADGEVAEAGQRRGAVPVLTWELSSWKVTSRIQWILFSMSQCALS